MVLFCVRLGNNTNISWKKDSRFWMVGLGATSKLPWRYNHALVMGQYLWWVFCLFHHVIPIFRDSVIRIVCTTCIGMWFLLLLMYLPLRSMDFEEHIFKMEFLRGLYRKSWATIFCKVTCLIIDKPNTPP